MKRIKYYEVNNVLESNLFILDGEVIYVRIDGFTFSIIQGEETLYSETTLDLRTCKKRVRSKLLEIGVVLENELRSKI